MRYTVSETSRFAAKKLENASGRNSRGPGLAGAAQRPRGGAPPRPRGRRGQPVQWDSNMKST